MRTEENVMKKKYQCIIFPPLFIFTCFSLVFSGCVGKELSIEEAKEVSVSMRDEGFVAPPRNIDDILSLLKQTGNYDTAIATNRKKIITSYPPSGASPADLGKFYMKRGDAFNDLGLSQQAHEDLLTAYSYYDDVKNTSDRKEILFNLALAEKRVGNMKEAIALLNKTIADEPWSRDYLILIGAYGAIGDLAAAEKAAVKGIAMTRQKIARMSSNSKKMARLADKITGNRANLLGMQAILHRLRGEYDKEEQSWRETVRLSESVMNKAPAKWIHTQIALANFLYRRNRYMEAELEAREAVEKSIGLSGKISLVLGDALRVIAKIKLAQGRYDEAEKLVRHELVILKESGVSEDSSSVAKARSVLARILTSKGDHAWAVNEYEILVKSLKRNKALLGVIVISPELLLSLIEVGRTQDAAAFIRKKYEKVKRRTGENSVKTARYLGLRGLAGYKEGNIAQAQKDFSAAIPRLLEAQSGRDTVLFQSIIENYIAMLAEISGTAREKGLGINAATEAFRMAETLRGKIVQEAVTASSVRTTVAMPELADLIRKEQDALQQRDALQETLSNTLGLAPAEQDQAVIASLKEKINNLTLAGKAFIKEIETGFPSYSELIKPSQPSIADIQSMLIADEALVSIFAGKDKTYIWAIPKSGTHQFVIVDYGKRKLRETVAELRKALNPDIAALGDIPAFDVEKAYRLYTALLQPVEKSISSVQNLIVVADGPLGALPFSILPTKPGKLRNSSNILFDEYEDIDWLIRKTTVSRMPSASTLLTLRSVPPGDPARKAFIGFGDPLFSVEQQQEAKSSQTESPMMLAGRGGKIKLRGIRIVAQNSLDSKEVISSQLENLIRLPDTADEIKGIADSLKADPLADVFLGARASEKVIKSMDLSDRRVIAFASHALVPGDLDGLQQPALALSAPSITGDQEDGLLTMGEVLKLQLNADWVVLSACNTGAAAGEGAEALSGLGRAFFYAGARSILASMWPVETTSAYKLTTGIFKNQEENSGLSRAAALRKSILALIDGPGLTDESTGQTVASYAHPLFWAPFILVGDGR